jgi:hypothetical protein
MTPGDRSFVAALILGIGAMAGCNAASKAGQATQPPVGADRDAHGCIASAGYTWCAREAACVRPWELAQQRGFANTSEAFAKYCLDASQ